MTTVEYAQSGFKISDLWTDKRSRGILIQIFALLGLFAFVAYIVNNTINNLELLGVETGYGFLNDPANYDINQRLIEYDSRSSNARATLVGILNTGLVAVTGIILATILGFTAGVLRLSKNWLISRLVYCYVEFTRNVPVLLQILLWHGIIITTLPRPKNALEPASGMFLSNRGFVLPKPQFEPAMWAVVIAFFAAIGGAIWFKRYAANAQAETGKIYPVFTVAAALIIGLPIIVFFLAGVPVFSSGQS